MYNNQSAEEIAARIEAGEDLYLLDVREPNEWEIASIAKSERKAMSQINEWVGELPQDREIVVFCHHGGRSAQVCHALATQAGFTQLTNMTGGIDRWSLQVDPSVKRY
ncbi:rhodanese-like domain-containing protein [Herpetosiphon sp. NSE202]|uniref:rhodanese-like domain-containing protein n=1 Tax=Herpetosiphon sp. NSE202 TaxID=3351349 RepID=UPI00364544F9